jgi:hypothetical protein
MVVSDRSRLRATPMSMSGRGSSGVDRDKPKPIKTIQPVSSVGGLLGLEGRF